MSLIPDSHRDLADAPVATLATIGPDGRPQLSVVWFLIEGDTIRISLNTARQKTKNLHADPKAGLLVLDPSGYRYLELRGDVTIAPDDDYEFASKVGVKYDNTDMRTMDKPGEHRVVVTLHPTRVNAVDMSNP
jgi:PPOX class probable F420-dependent enzyme